MSIMLEGGFIMTNIDFLESTNVRLRRYSKQDIPLVLEYINHPEVQSNLNPNIILPYSIEEEEKWFESHAKNPNIQFSFAIERKSDGAYVGGCGWNNIDWKNSYAYLGIWLGIKFCGQGLGTEAMRILLTYLFCEMNLNRVALKVHSYNKRAIRSYEKNGFHVEGVLRQEIFRDGQYHDNLIMGILHSEWLQQQKKS